MAEGQNVSGSAMPRRRSQRVLMQVSVRINGTDSQGNSFAEDTETLAVNAHGALILLNTRVTSGSTLKMLHKGTQEEQECHVVFLGPVRAGKSEIGLEFSGPRPGYWRVAFPPPDWSSRNPEARTVSTTRIRK